MTLFVTLASEAVGEKTWWNPYAKGAIVAILAIGLFVGSAYLLLYTNVGTRLGFLLTAAAFTGFMAVLSVFWITGQFPNGPLGPASSWPVEEVVPSLDESRFDAVQGMDPDEAAPGDIVGQVRADLDVELTDNDGEFDLFGSAGDFLVVNAVVEGGGRKWPFWWSEKTTYAAVELCRATSPEARPLEPPPAPECDPGEDTVWVVSVHDLGARRLPAWFFFAGSTLLFALTLFSLHVYERDVEQGGRRRGGGGPGGDGEGPGGDGEVPSGNGSARPETQPAPSTS